MTEVNICFSGKDQVVAALECEQTNGLPRKGEHIEVWMPEYDEPLALRVTEVSWVFEVGTDFTTDAPQTVYIIGEETSRLCEEAP